MDLSPDFPWGNTWTATFNGKSHIWKFTELQNADFGFFEDENQQSLSFEQSSYGYLHGQFIECNMIGKYDPKTATATLTTKAGDQSCKDVGPTVVIKMSK